MSRRPRAAAALSAFVCIAVAGGALLNHRFQTRRYAGGDALYSWVQHNLRHARIAIAGLVLCLPVGLVMIGFTRWSVTVKVVVAIVVAWVIFGLLVSRH